MVIQSTLVSKCSEGRSKENQLPPLPPFFLSFTPTRVAKEDFLPSAGLVGIVFDPEKQEVKMDE